MTVPGPADSFPKYIYVVIAVGATFVVGIMILALCVCCACIQNKRITEEIVITHQVIEHLIKTPALFHGHCLAHMVCMIERDPCNMYICTNTLNVCSYMLCSTSLNYKHTRVYRLL